MIEESGQTKGDNVSASVKVRLPERGQILRQLHRYEASARSAEHLFPLIIDRLYDGGDEKTGAEIGAALIGALKVYLQGFDERERRQMQAGLVRNIMRYLEAISFYFPDYDDSGERALDAAIDYCRQHINELAP